MATLINLFMNSLLKDSIAILDQGNDFLSQLSSASYQEKKPNCFDSSIGGHIRHNLDHYWSLLRGLSDGYVDYDARARDPRVESDPHYATGFSKEIISELRSIKPSELDMQVRVKMDTGSHLLPQDSWAGSTVRRELQFLLSHTVHHYALISILCQQLGVEVPAGFGIAPSTFKHRQVEV